MQLQPPATRLSGAKMQKTELEHIRVCRALCGVPHELPGPSYRQEQVHRSAGEPSCWAATLLCSKSSFKGSCCMPFFSCWSKRGSTLKLVCTHLLLLGCDTDTRLHNLSTPNTCHTADASRMPQPTQTRTLPWTTVQAMTTARLNIQKNRVSCCRC